MLKDKDFFLFRIFRKDFLLPHFLQFILIVSIPEVKKGEVKKQETKYSCLIFFIFIDQCMVLR